MATSAVVGACLALAVGVFATVVRLDRDRAFYPTVAIVIASLYSLFAVMGGSTRALVVESIVGVGFIALAVLGFRSSLWVVVAALSVHGVFDLVHGTVISNPGVRRRGGGVLGVVDHEPTYPGSVTSFSLGAARPPNKELKLTKPGGFRSFAA